MKQYKSINFDLDTKELKKKYPGNSYENAYYDIREFFKYNGFEHRQGSGYIFVKKLESSEVVYIIDKLINIYPWLRGCVNKLDVSDIVYDNYFDLTFMTMPLDEQEQEIGDPNKTISKTNDKKIDDTYIKPETEKPVRKRHR